MGRARREWQAGASASARTCPRLSSMCVAMGVRALPLNVLLKFTKMMDMVNSSGGH